MVHYKSSAFKQVCATSGNLIVGDITIEAGTCRDIPQGIQDETVITDTAGHYVLPLVNAGPFTLTAEDTLTGKTAQIVGAIKPGQTGDFSIRLLGLSTLTIRVKGSDSTTPIPGRSRIGQSDCLSTQEGAGQGGRYRHAGAERRRRLQRGRPRRRSPPTFATASPDAPAAG